MTARRILVTGGSGFIGTHLRRALAAAGHVCTNLDLRVPLNSFPAEQFVQGDVRDATLLKQLLASTDLVIHLAAIVSVELCERTPRESHSTNVQGTFEVLEAARARKTPVVFASSAAVYGMLGQAGVPIRESEPLPEPLSFYALHKRSGEQLMRHYARTFEVPTFVFRFFNVFGEGQDPASPYSGVITIFDSRLKRGDPLLLNGGGVATRDFVAVEDITRALVATLGLDPARGDGEPINLGTGRAITVRELAERMARAAGRDPQDCLRDAPARPGDVPHSCASVERARERLGWRAEREFGAR